MLICVERERERRDMVIECVEKERVVETWW